MLPEQPVKIPVNISLWPLGKIKKKYHHIVQLVMDPNGMGLPSGFSFCQADCFQKLASRNGVRLVELKPVFQIKSAEK